MRLARVTHGVGLGAGAEVRGVELPAEGGWGWKGGVGACVDSGVRRGARGVWRGAGGGWGRGAKCGLRARREEGEEGERA